MARGFIVSHKGIVPCCLCSRLRLGLTAQLSQECCMLPRDAWDIVYQISPRIMDRWEVFGLAVSALEAAQGCVCRNPVWGVAVVHCLVKLA